MLPLALVLLFGAQDPSLLFDGDASAVTWLRSPDSGRVLVSGEGSLRGGVLEGPGRLRADAAVQWSLGGDGGRVALSARVADAAPGVMGTALALRGIPDDMDAIVPVMSGLRFTAKSAQTTFRAEWPIMWEAGFVVFQREGEGLLVYSHDPRYTFKAFSLEHRKGYWDLLLESHNDAPVADKTGQEAPPWVLVPYTGDWRVGVGIYRDYLTTRQDLAAPRASQPPWVADIRTCVLVGVDEPLLDALAERLDPKETLLYVPDWRTFGYDRNYPEYTARPEVKPFIEHAHRLGFRVMPHANYFGLDPLHPLYARYEASQLLDRDTGEKLWWTWDRAEPPIKFAYIHPGDSAWRKELIGRLRASWEDLGFDALHIDQTLCIFNHQGGLVEGLNCAEANLLLHRELREALPEVALSGEGLDEVTFPYEAFAQRHVYGLDHTNGRWDRDTLDLAFPVSSYLFTPHTTIYGYLGMSSPANDQLYAAWRQAYRSYNVIPTIAWPNVEGLRSPSGFLALALREARAWQDTDLACDPDSEWPAEVCYPYRTSDGRRATYREESGTTFSIGEDEIARIVTSVEQLRAPGSIPGWRYYDAEALLGLDPFRWYAYETTPRSLTEPHVESAPEGARVVLNTPPVGLMRVALDARGAGLDLVRLARSAECEVALSTGETVRGEGRLEGPETLGAMLRPMGEVIEFHPAWVADPASGRAARGAPMVRYRLDLPADSEPVFRASGFIEPAAGERTDGVDFTVRAIAGERALEVTVHCDARGQQPIELDLGPLAGGEVTLEIVCDDGSDDNPSFDWARLGSPRVEMSRRGEGRVLVADDFSTIAMRVPFGGACYLRMPEAEAPPSLPLDLLGGEWLVSFRQLDDSDRTDPGMYAVAALAEATCAGESRPALHTHPPDHGQIVLQRVFHAPAGALAVRADVGLRDGSKSEGVEFAVRIGGLERARLRVEPGGGWHPLEAVASDLPEGPVVVELVLDSIGGYDFDWAVWSRLMLGAE